MFCVPHGIDNNYGTGPNELIKEGAKLITEPNDIIRYFETKGKNFIDKKKYNKQYDNEILNLLSKEILTKEELAIKANESISKINQQITILELEEKITHEIGKGYRIIE